jgi:ParB-like chromosome segregation protein Spo0J
VGEDGGLIAGHARILAARQLGIAEIPVMVAAGWPSALRAADGALALHRLVQTAGTPRHRNAACLSPAISAQTLAF